MRLFLVDGTVIINSITQLFTQNGSLRVSATLFVVSSFSLGLI